MTPVVWMQVALGLVVVAVGVVALWYVRRGRVRVGKLRALPQVDIDGMGLGPAKISGRVELDGEPLIAPITGRPCIAYRVQIVSRYRMQGRERQATVVEREEGRSFWLVSGSARARVELPPASDQPLDSLNPKAVRSMTGVHLELGLATRYPAEDLGAAEQQRILAWVGYSEQRHDARWLFREVLLEPGDLVTIAGDTTAATPGQYRQQPTAPTVGVGQTGLLIER